MSFTSAAQAAPGDPDLTFSGDGLQLTDFGRGPSEAAAVARQADGKLVVVGTSADRTNFTLARYNADGSLDTTFSGDGKQTTDFASDADRANGVVVQADGKIVVVGRGGGGGDFALARYSADGSLDTSFSGDGKQTTDFAGGADEAFGVVVQADGRIVVVGVTDGAAPPDFALVRYNADGSLDATFSDDGKQTTDIGGFDEAHGVVLQPDGKIVAVGTGAESPHAANFALARYTADGSLDGTFSGDGKQTTDFGGDPDGSDLDEANGLVLQADAKVVVVGRTLSLGGFLDFALARYNPDGSLDTTFSGDGKQTTNVGGAGGANGVVLQPDGKIVAAGDGAAGGNFALTRYNADGSLDTSFSGDGKQTTDFGRFDDTANGVVLQPDGRIVAAGAGAGDFALARYNADGSLDVTFSGDGKQTTEFPGNDRATAVALQADGKVVTVGSNGPGDFTLARYNADGSLDTTFAGDGKQTTDLGSDADRANGVAVQADGKIVAVGLGGQPPFGPPFDFALARYNADGSLDTTFSSDGKQTTDFAGTFDEANGVAVQADGKIVAVGSSSAQNDFALARYNPDGSLDTTFSGDGKQTTDFGSFEDDEAFGIAVQADGKIVAVGSGGGVGIGVGVDFALARYNADGSLDGTFSGDGKQTTDFADSFDVAKGVVVQADGKIIGVGTTFSGGVSDFALARYDPDGSSDTTFSADGQQTTDFAGGLDEANGLVVQANGKIVAVGLGGGSLPDFALARYSPAGSLDTTFSGDGKQTTDFAGRSDRAFGVALQSDGKIVAAGGATGETEDFAVARYEGDGAPADTTPPQTTITSGPAEGATTDDNTPTFEFTSSEASSTFNCRVDGGSAFSCSSPVTTTDLSDGQHTLSVAATDAAGNTDPTPATRTFTVRTASGGGPPGEQPPAEQPPAAAPLAPLVPSLVTTLASVAPVRFGTSAGASATVSASGLVRLSRPMITCPSGPPACGVTVAASAQLPSVLRSSARSAATRRTRIGRSTFSVAPGQTARIRFRLTRSGLSALKRQKRLRTTVRVVATHGTRRTARTITVTLTAPRHPRR